MVINIIDLNLLKIVLKKYYIENNINYTFFDISISDLEEEIKTKKPSIICIQDKFFGFDIDEFIKKIFKIIKEQNLNTKIFLIYLDENPQLFNKYKDEIIFINLKNLNEIKNYFNIYLKAEQKVEPEKKVKKQFEILFVDDSNSMHSLINNFLQNNDNKIYHAYSGVEAIKKYYEILPDLIITDIEMPEMNGLELCKKIKEQSINRFIPIIILSSRSDKITIEEAFNYGADDYLIKPIDGEKLKAIIERYRKIIHSKKKNKILIIDDSKIIREYLRHSLLKQGFSVITAENGKIGYEIIKKEKPDIILTDIEMPLMDGYELCKKIKNDNELNEIPILIMSSKDKAYDIKKANELGIVHYFVKPFDIEKLILVIDRLIIEKYDIYKKETEYMLLTIQSLIKALEARDEYTKGHTERVAELSVKLGKYMGLSENEINELKIAANLHDIGKIGIKDEILLKPDKLTDDEYLIIQEHTIIGAEILKPIKSLSKIIPLILHHHERWDGAGYPGHISKEQIPLGARIIAIVDSYDAMTSNRPYRKKLRPEEAIKIIKENAGKQYCPKCVDAFLKMMAEEKNNA
ncbi:MAG TPA: response regulator [bacterium]|nr:response regulator [bacterium]